MVRPNATPERLVRCILDLKVAIDWLTDFIALSF